MLDSIPSDSNYVFTPRALIVMDVGHFIIEAIPSDDLLTVAMFIARTFSQLSVEAQFIILQHALHM